MPTRWPAPNPYSESVLDRVRRTSPRTGDVAVSDEGTPGSRRVKLREVDYRDRDEFLGLVRDSRALHHPWAYPPERGDQFDELVARARREDVVTLLGRRASDDALFGVFTISQIVRGAFQSAYLGYYGHAQFTGQGYMSAALALVLDHAFGPLSLHRIEANIQPGNAPSVALARGAGFRLEGFSPRYLLIGGRWRDHERYAITAEEHGRRGTA
ncbi:MAG: [ribosomal protein S5]-alanine N-acetyltransferase [Solirubrobacteraceae bacterium]|nr:[ribosomal protein S5]-alanine N-acetyltransferase [Solirubrobacteraceae bacterium]